MQRLGFATIFALVLAACICVLNPVGFLGLFGAPIATVWAVALTVSGAFLLRSSAASLCADPAKARTAAAAAVSPLHRCLHILLLALSVPVFFEGSNIAARARYDKLGNAMLFDEMLIAVDEAFLGSFFPRGQFSLWLDTNPVIGVTTFFGRVASELLQVLYVSYYLWGNGLMIYLLYRYYSAATSPAAAASSAAAVAAAHADSAALVDASPYALSDGSVVNSPVAGLASPSSLSTLAPPLPLQLDAPTLAWHRLALTVAALVSTFHFNFLLNLVMPAVSPRIYLADAYVNPVKCLFLGDILRGAVTKAAARSFSAFPSGHCGLSWLTALAARRLGLKRLAPLSLAAAVCITTATLTLRYHYAADALGALLLLAWGRRVGCLGSQAAFAAAVTAGADPEAAAAAAAEADADADAEGGLVAKLRLAAAAGATAAGLPAWVAYALTPAPGSGSGGPRYVVLGKPSHLQQHRSASGQRGARSGGSGAGGAGSATGFVAATGLGEDDDDDGVVLDRMAP